MFKIIFDYLEKHLFLQKIIIGICCCLFGLGLGIRFSSGSGAKPEGSICRYIAEMAKSASFFAETIGQLRSEQQGDQTTIDKANRTITDSNQTIARLYKLLADQQGSEGQTNSDIRRQLQELQDELGKVIKGNDN